MKTGIFPARKTQQQYALKLSEKIEQTLPDIDQCLVFPRKHIMPSILYMSPFSNLSHQEAKKITALEVKEKSNVQLGKPLAGWFILLYGLMKYIEACILFRVYRSRFKQSGISQLILWNGLKLRQRIATIAARSLNIPCYFIERGALPGTTTLDARGINYLNSVPRSTDFFFHQSFQGNQKFPAIKNQEKPLPGLPERYIFVPFQVNTDTQITMFSPWINHMPHLVEVLMELETELGKDMPEIVLKTHPACPQDYKQLEKHLMAFSKRIHFVNNLSPKKLIASADAVLTINSSVGMEAILANVPLIVIGQAFYDIPGLTTRASSISELQHIFKYHSYSHANQQLRNRFLSWLDKEYVVHGCWHKADDEHFQSMASRYQNLLETAREAIGTTLVSI